MRQRLQECARGAAVAVHAGVREREGSEQPAPHGALMVGAVTLALISGAAAAVPGIAWRQTAEAERRHQLARADGDDPSLELERERALRERDGQELIGPQRGV